MNTKPTIQVIAENIERLRTERGWNKTALAEHCGIDRSFISRLVQGNRNVSIDALDKIAGAFGIETFVLLKPHNVEEVSLHQRVADIESLEPIKQQVIVEMLNSFLREKQIQKK